jgi:hypothetical protein
MADFAQALNWLKAGRKVHRTSWGNQACYFQARASIGPFCVPPALRVIYMGAQLPEDDARQAYFSFSGFDGRDWELFRE